MMKNFYLPHGSGDSKAWCWHQLDSGEDLIVDSKLHMKDKSQVGSQERLRKFKLLL